MAWSSTMTNSVDRQIGARLRQVREAAGLKPEALAAVIGVDAEVLTKIEAGELRLRPAIMQKAIKALNVPVAELFRETVLAWSTRCSKSFKAVADILRSGLEPHSLQFIARVFKHLLQGLNIGLSFIQRSLTHSTSPHGLLN
jgi:DNA-binding XRE family transcriptional regulator